MSARAWLLTLLFSVGSVARADAETALTSESVAKRALVASGSVLEKRAELEQADARMTITRRQFAPQLTVRASYTRLNPLTTTLGSGAQVGTANGGPLTVGPCPGAGTQTCVLDALGVPAAAARSNITYPNDYYALNASLTVPLSDLALRAVHAASLASSDREAVKYALEAERLKVWSDARVLYFNWLRSHDQVRIAEQAVQQTQARLGEVKTAFEVGTLSRVDVLKIEALVANAERALKDAHTHRELVSRQLAIVMDDRGAPLYRAGEEVPALDAKEADLAAGDEVTAGALGRRLEVKSLDAAARALEHSRASLNVTRAPRLDAVGQVDYGNPNQRYFPPTPRWRATWSVGLVASWSLGDTLVTGGRLRELSAKRSALLGHKRALIEAICAEIAQRQAAVKSARAALVAAGVNLEAQEEGYRVASESLQLGKVTASYLVDAESDLFNARLAMLHGRISTLR